MKSLIFLSNILSGNIDDFIYYSFCISALGQVMLYVDGMNGVINHNETIQWLYSLLSSKVKRTSIVDFNSAETSPKK